MHDDDLPVTDALIRDLVARDTLQWAGEPLRRVNSSGTDNALFRIGENLVLRIPRRLGAVPSLAKELDWLPYLDGLPLAVPGLRHRGRVDLGFHCDYGIFDWMDGEIAAPDAISDVGEAALSLATFLGALHCVPTEGAPVAGPANKLRGIPLEDMTERTLQAIEIVADEIDAPAAVALWNDALAERHGGRPVWLHGDLKADNLLATGGRLSGVIDWGLSAVGDPAADYATAWSWGDPSGRDAFRAALELGDGDWLRGRAWALYGAVIALGYYRGGRNEPLTRQCRLTLSRLGLMR
jgi:aminoglycoside phosphotransferase (APT) family kinase protein